MKSGALVGFGLGVVLLGTIFGQAHLAPTNREISLRKGGAVLSWAGRGKFFRWPNMVLAIVVLGIVAVRWGGWATGFVAISPGLWQMAMFDIEKLLAVVLVVGLVAVSGKRAWVVGAVLLGGWVLWVGLQTNLPQQSEAVDLRTRTEYRLNNYDTVWPAALKRVVYNKYYFGWLEIQKKVVGLGDAEKISSPGQETVTVTRNLWTQKGLPQVYFWQVLVILLLVVAPTMASNKWLKAAAVVMGVWSVVMFVPHFVLHEVYWRDNRPSVQLQMAQLAAKYAADKVKVTTLLGATDDYYWWVTGRSEQPGVSFDHFDLTQQKSDLNTVYIGLPGEFLGSRTDKNTNYFAKDQLPTNFQLLEQYPIRDTVSFGNGDAIWVIKTI